MDINVFNSKWRPLALLTLCVVSGCCCQAVPLPGENQCPTDARRLYFSCGEEAVRRCPCGPDREFYGLKPTCWRAWPEGWHCNQCEGSPCAGDFCGEPVFEKPAPAEIDVSNPFRSKAGVGELPKPPIATETPPTKPKPPERAPTQLAPVEQKPTPPPTVEKAPLDFGPVIDLPIETVPDAKPPTVELPAEQPPSAPVIPPQTPAVVPPAPDAAPIPTTQPLTPPPAKPPAEPAPKATAPKQTSHSEPSPAAPKDAKEHAAASKSLNVQAPDPAVSKRVGQHLFNNLRM